MQQHQLGNIVGSNKARYLIIPIYTIENGISQFDAILLDGQDNTICSSGINNKLDHLVSNDTLTSQTEHLQPIKKHFQDLYKENLLQRNFSEKIIYQCPCAGTRFLGDIKAGGHNILK